VTFDPGCLLPFAINAYASLLFVFIIVQFLQSFAQVQIPDPLRPALNFVYDVCEPYLRIWRGLLPAMRLGAVGLDLSPIIGFIVLRIVAAIVSRVLPC
jgi:YggT family protein